VVFSPSAQTGVILLANIWPAPSPYTLAEDIAELVVREFGPVGDHVESNLIEVTEQDASSFIGRYWSEPGVYIEVVYGESGFGLGSPGENDYSLHAPAGLQIDPAVNDSSSFRTVGGRSAGELAEFTLNSEEKAESFRLGGFLYKRVD